MKLSSIHVQYFRAKKTGQVSWFTQVDQRALAVDINQVINAHLGRSSVQVDINHDIFNTLSILRQVRNRAGNQAMVEKIVSMTNDTSPTRRAAFKGRSKREAICGKWGLRIVSERFKKQGNRLYLASWPLGNN